MRLGFRKPGGGPFNGHATLANNLVSYWKLDETSGVRVDAIAASGNDLTDNNTVTSTTGIKDTAAQFTAANSESLSHIDSAALSFAGSSFSAASWFQTTTTVGNGTIIGKYGTGKEWMVYRATNLIAMAFSTNGTAFAGQAITVAPISINAWHLAIGWHDLGAGKYFIQVDDGTVFEQAGADITDTTEDFRIGGGFAFLDGLVDASGLWNRTLTTQERTDLYSGGAGLFY